MYGAVNMCTDSITEQYCIVDECTVVYRVTELCLWQYTCVLEGTVVYGTVQLYT